MYSKDQDILLEKFADSSDKLFHLNVISTDSFTGEIGEYIACRALNLTKAGRVTRAVDAYSNTNQRYQVKSKIVVNSYNYSFKGLENNLFDYLIVVYFDKFYSPIKILKIPSKSIKAGELKITKSNIDTYQTIDISKLNIPQKTQKVIGEFANSYSALIEMNIIRSRRIVGDIGEYYAARRLNLILSENKNEKGIDARHSNGMTFEIKTRRVYESGRRVSKTRRLNNLVGKSADYLIVVTLDRFFKCSGMWVMPMKNVMNKKSANLMVVNKTLGSLNLIPSKISWLGNGEKYISLSQLKSTLTMPKLTPQRIHTSNEMPVNDINQMFHFYEKDLISDKWKIILSLIAAVLFTIYVIIYYSQ